MKEMVMARIRGALVGATTLAAVLCMVTAGSTAASASTRLRSGTLHAQLVSHVSSAAGTNGLSSGLTIQGSAVMAGVVGVLALCAFAFLVVTLIRHRA
jgi:hypothetical protein